jgi:transposase InsO family protein
MSDGQLLRRHHERAERDTRDERRAGHQALDGKTPGWLIELLREQTTVAEAARTHGLNASDISAWVTFYNSKRPHEALGYLSPERYRAAHTQLHVA